MQYHDMILAATDPQLERTPDKRQQGRFKVYVVLSPDGYMDENKAVPVVYDDTELQPSLGKLASRSPELDRTGLIALGRKLGDLLLPQRGAGQDKSVRDYFLNSLLRIGPDAGLRLRLRLPRQLHALPWEYIYVDRMGGDQGIFGFVSLNQRVVIIRHEEEGVPEQPVLIQGDIRVLAAMASPEGAPDLDLGRERVVLERALGRRTGIKPQFLVNAELADVQAAIPDTHIFHFAGHGQFDRTKMGVLPGTYEGQGSIVFDDQAVSAQDLGVAVQGSKLRLAVLGGCETGRRDGINVWSGIAPTLIKAQVPAVVANQFSILDYCAIAFSQQFYQALARGEPVELAVSQGRKAAYLVDPLGRDWGVPVLYLQAPDGRLFVGGPEGGTPQEAEEPQTGKRQLRLSPSTGSQRFFDRRDDLERIVATLNAGRRVLIHGPLGIGKTALAQAAAQQLHTHGAYRNRVLWLSNLGKVTAAEVCDQIASLLDDEEIRKLDGKAKFDPTRRLLGSVQGLLLVLDRLESAEAFRQLIDVVVPNDTSLLVICRIRQAIPPSQMVPFRLHELPLDDAAALFCYAAGIAGGDQESVREICQLLGSHPQAVLLAANRVYREDMPLVNLRERVRKAGGPGVLLGSEEGDSDEGISGLGVSWRVAYEGLNNGQRLVLSQLAACFEGSVGLELLAQTCGLPYAECEDRIGELVRCSMVERSDERVGLQRLFRDMVRNQLGDQLPAAQEKSILAAQSYIDQHRGTSAKDKDALEAEVGNLLAAIRSAGSSGRAAQMLSMARLLVDSGVLYERNRWSELIEVGQRGAEAAKEDDNPFEAARFQHTVANVLVEQGNYAQARSLYEENLETFRSQGNAKGVANTLTNLGQIERREGDYRAARKYLQESKEIKEREHLTQDLASTLYELGQLDEHACRFASALCLYQKSSQLDEKYGNRLGVAGNWHRIGVIRQIQGEPDQAEDLYSRCLEIFKVYSDRLHAADVQRCLGWLSYERGGYDQAQQNLEESLDAGQRLQSQLLVADALFDLGMLAYELGAREDARRRIEESRTKYSRLGTNKGAAYCRLQLARLAWEDGKYDEAQRHLDEAKRDFQKLKVKLGSAACLYEQGRMAEAQGQIAAAETLQQQSLAAWTRLRYRLGIAHNLYALGRLAQARGTLDEARWRCQESLSIFESLGSPHADAVRQSLAHL